jgi:hypothetical protein
MNTIILPTELINHILSFREATPTAVLIKNRVAEFKKMDIDEATLAGEYDPEDPKDVEYFKNKNPSLILSYRAYERFVNLVYTARYTKKGLQTGLFVQNVQGRYWVVEEVKTLKNAWA